MSSGEERGLLSRTAAGNRAYDSVHALEIHDVALAKSCIACALEMRSSNGRESP